MSPTLALSVRARLATLSVAMLAGAAAAQVNLTTVALTGQSAPGGLTWDSFFSYYPMLTAQGRASFGGSLLGVGLPPNTFGCFVGMPGNLVPMPKDNDPAPGLPGLTVESMGLAMVGDDGSTTWAATVAGPGVTTSNDRVWYGGTPANPVILGRRGSQAVGLPAGVVYNGMYYPYANNGHSIMAAWLAGPGLTQYFNDLAMWTGHNGALSLIARSSMQAPGCPIGVSFQNFTALQAINASGNAAFTAVLQGAGVTGDNMQIAVFGQAGALNKVAREGDPAPGLPAGSVYSDSFSILSLNNANVMTFSSHIAGPGVTEANDSVLWRGTLGAMSLAAREGTQAPGCPAGVLLGEIGFYPYIGGGNRLLFSGTVTGAGVMTSNDTAWWTGTPGAYTLVAREGGQVPGCPPGVVFADLTDVYPSLNAAGKVYFKAPIAGLGVTTDNDEAIVATGPNGGLRIIARKGGLMTLGPGDSRTISELDCGGGSGGQDGRGGAVSDAGQAIFMARFTNQTAAIFIADINTCWANCDASSVAPVLNVSDFSCFLNKFAAGDSYANCDGSAVAPVLNVSDFACFLNKIAAGCP